VLFPNPLGVAALGPVWSGLLLGTLTAAGLASLPLLAIVVAALVTRFRRGGPEVRQQVKWLAFALAVMLVAQLVGPIRDTATGGPASGPLVIASDTVSAAVPLAVVPAVVTLAILKYRLYQIDVIINKAVKYGLLLAALTAVYAAIVVGIGTLAGYVGGPLLTVAAAVAIAVLFQPARNRAQLLANRLVYGRRATPYQVLSDFAQDMAAQPDAATTLDRMAALLARATGATRLAVWIRVGEQLRPQAAGPAGQAAAEPVPLVAGGLPDFGATATRAVAVRHGNELLGALTVVKPPDDPVSAAEDSLLAHLASQIGLVLRNLRLTAELQATIDDLKASRRRLVRAQDEERHRIERNLHDGAQQQLVALSMLLRLLDDSAEDPGEVKQLADQLKDGLRAALEDLRALARGIYPPLLAEQGLRAALRGHADRVPVPVLIEADGIGRYGRDTEATAYFCILEALQNVAKYARASRATVELGCPDGHLEFTIADDGVGFDAATTTTGTGLQGMADRLAAAGGSLRFRSAPGTGTIIYGRLPVLGSLRSGRALAGPAGGDHGQGEVIGVDLLPAVAADERRVQVVPARVTEHRGRAVDRPLVSPGAQRLEDRAEFPARLGEFVFMARRVVAVLDAGDHPGGLERAQPGGQPVAGRAGIAGDRVEPLVAERDLADREQRPLLADHVQGGRYRAGTAGQILAHTHKHTRLLNQTHSGYASVGFSNSLMLAR
jgi:signal transduction histidine kinase